jgi:hypothetical protein
VTVDLRSEGGWAASRAARRSLFAAIPREGAQGPPYAAASAWAPPDPLSVPAVVCERFRTATRGSRAYPSLAGTYFLPEIGTADRTAVLDRVAAANAMWWQLDLDRFDITVKRYRAGDGQLEHQDLHPGSPTRKLVATVQLSDTGDYTGGALTVRMGDQLSAMPTSFGTLVVLPAWSVHGVQPITRGERWAAIVNGYGPPLR